ncbi:MAG TPA: sulfate ABC transporter permease subunit [Coriobacteriia bacterium]|jgi:sulfate transport system permease protein
MRRSLPIRGLLISVTVAWLLLVLALPFAYVFSQAFAGGFAVFRDALAQPEALAAVRLSAIATTVALVANLVFGVAAGWALARTRFPGRSLVLVLLDLPIAVSPVVAGLMFVLLFGRQGWFGPWLEAVGVKVVFALPGILIATTFVTLPFIAREVLTVLEETGTAEEEAALTLGASRTQMFVHIVLPAIRWALFYGVVLTAARALGEFGAVSVVSGNIAGQTQTLPLHIEAAYIDYDVIGAFASAVPLTVMAALTILAQKVVAALSSRERGARVAEVSPTEGAPGWTSV